MTEWLKLILGRIDALPSEYPREVSDEIQEGEEVIGEVPEALRRFWGVGQQLHDEADKLLREHGEKRSEDLRSGECDDVHAQAAWLNIQALEVGDIYWTSLRHELSLGAKEIDHRKGWKIVSLPKRKLTMPMVTIIEVTGMGFPQALGVLNASRPQSRG